MGKRHSTDESRRDSQEPREEPGLLPGAEGRREVGAALGAVSVCGPSPFTPGTCRQQDGDRDLVTGMASTPDTDHCVQDTAHCCHRATSAARSETQIWGLT